jgi:hypothetical protein
MVSEDEMRKLLLDPNTVVEIGEPEPPPVFGNWAHVSLVGCCGLSKKQRQRDRDRAKKRAREREERLKARIGNPDRSVARGSRAMLVEIHSGTDSVRPFLNNRPTEEEPAEREEMRSTTSTSSPTERSSDVALYRS